MICMTTNGYCIASYEDFTSLTHFLKAAKKKAKKTNPPIDAYIADATISPMGAVRLYPLGLHPDKPEECKRVWVADFGEGGSMIEIKLRTVHQEGVVPAYAEAFGEWAVNTPVTEDEYKRFAEELDKAREVARQIYLQANGIKEGI